MLSYQCRLSMLVMLLLGAPMAPGQSATGDGAQEPAPLIQLTQDGATDERIQRRIEEIFTKIDGVGDVNVDVDAGIVTLAGEVANEAQARDALDIATRTAGVIKVDDQIDRTLDVRGNVEPLLDSLKNRVHGFVRALPLIGLALLVFLFFAYASGVVARWSALWRRLSPNPFLADLLAQAVRVAGLIGGAIIALNLLGASKFIATILGGAGVLGIAIGFAVRDSMENYISSIMLSLRQPFRARDHVVINDREGIVVRLTSRATILMTLDGNHLRIPNSVVFKGIILNYSTNPERRFDFVLGVDANDDPLAAMQVGMDAIKALDFVLDEPQPVALISDVGDSNIVIRFSAWVNQTDTSFAKARSVAISQAKTALEQGGFTLPEPIYRLRMEQGSAAVSVSPVAAQEKPAAPSERDAQPPVAIDEATIDVSADQDLVEKVDAERAREADKDLLDSSRPVE